MALCIFVFNILKVQLTMSSDTLHSTNVLQTGKCNHFILQGHCSASWIQDHSNKSYSSPNHCLFFSFDLVKSINCAMEQSTCNILYIVIMIELFRICPCRKIILLGKFLSIDATMLQNYFWKLQHYLRNKGIFLFMCTNHL